MKADESGPPSAAGDQSERWDLRLYVASVRSKSVKAFTNLIRLCGQHMPGRYSIELVDFLEPQLAKGDEIIAIPTLVRKTAPADSEDCGRSIKRKKTSVGL